MVSAGLAKLTRRAGLVFPVTEPPGMLVHAEPLHAWKVKLETGGPLDEPE